MAWVAIFVAVVIVGVAAVLTYLGKIDGSHPRPDYCYGYRPHEILEKNAALRDVLDFIASGAIAGGDSNLFRPLLDRLLYEDPFLVLADYQAYADCQEQVSCLVA